MAMELTARKVIKGKNILLISLPSVWVKNAGVKPGMKLRCVVNDNGQLVLELEQDAVQILTPVVHVRQETAIVDGVNKEVQSTDGNEELLRKAFFGKK